MKIYKVLIVILFCLTNINITLANNKVIQEIKRNNYIQIEYISPFTYLNNAQSNGIYFTLEDVEFKDIKIIEGNKNIKVSQSMNEIKKVQFITLTGKYILNIKGNIIKLEGRKDGYVYINNQKVREYSNTYISNGKIIKNKYLNINDLILPPNVNFLTH